MVIEEVKFGASSSSLDEPAAGVEAQVEVDILIE